MQHMVRHACMPSLGTVPVSGPGLRPAWRLGARTSRPADRQSPLRCPCTATRRARLSSAGRSASIRCAAAVLDGAEAANSPRQASFPPFSRRTSPGPSTTVHVLCDGPQLRPSGCRHMLQERCWWRLCGGFLAAAAGSFGQRIHLWARTVSADAPHHCRCAQRAQRVGGEFHNRVHARTGLV